MKNTIVFIDGEYLKLIAKELFEIDISSLDLKGFALALANDQRLWCKDIFYYVAPPHQSKSATRNERKRKVKYDSFVGNLKKRARFTVREGRCQKIGKKFREKGVDTLMTIDLVTKPPKENVKTVILVTCDTDFVPAMDYLKSELQTNVIVYYYANRKRHSKFSMSNHILAACNKAVMLRKRHFEGCLLE